MNIFNLQQKKGQEKITMLTAYDYSTAQIVDQAGIDLILVGDSLGMVIKGESNTLNVSMEEMIYHTAIVCRAVKNCLVVADLPFLSYQASSREAIINAGKLLQAGAQAVKLEGSEHVETVSKLVKNGIPVMGHLGLTPQSVNLLGYKVQGKSEDQAQTIRQQAKDLQDAGVFSLVLELVPADLAKQISQELTIPVIGIGAGKHTDGQVLVINDVLGLSPRIPKFAKQYVDLKQIITQAVSSYRRDVLEKNFPI